MILSPNTRDFNRERFKLPEGTFPWVKMWDYGDLGLSIFVMPCVEQLKTCFNRNM